MNRLHQEIIDCLNYFGPQSLEQLTIHLYMRERNRVFSEAQIKEALEIVTKKLGQVRFHKNVYTSNYGNGKGRSW